VGGLLSASLGVGLVRVCLFLVMVAGFFSDLVVTMVHVVLRTKKSYTQANVLLLNHYPCRRCRVSISLRQASEKVS
jgi:hypothetical protein